MNSNVSVSDVGAADIKKSCSACPEDQLKPFEFLNFEFKFLNHILIKFW